MFSVKNIPQPEHHLAAAPWFGKVWVLLWVFLERALVGFSAMVERLISSVIIGLIRALWDHSSMDPCFQDNPKICDLWDAHGNWDFNSISFILHVDIFKTILASLRPLTPTVEDCNFWKATNNGQFNSSFAYRIACSLGNLEPAILDWKWLWKISTIPMVVSFLWLACHERLPTKNMLFKRKIVPDDSCPICKRDTESMMHTLREYYMDKTMWLNLGTSLPPIFFTSTCVKRLASSLVLFKFCIIPSPRIALERFISFSLLEHLIRTEQNNHGW